MMTSLGGKTFSVPLLPYRKVGIYATQIQSKAPDHRNKEGTYSICDNMMNFTDIVLDEMIQS